MNEESQNTSSDQGAHSSPNSESLQTNDLGTRNANFSDDVAHEATGSPSSNNDVIDTSRTFFAQNTTDDDAVVTPANYSPPNYISDDGAENDVVPYTPRPPSGPPPAYSPPAGGHGLPVPPPYCEEDVPVSMQIVPTRHHVVRFFLEKLM